MSFGILKEQSTASKRERNALRQIGRYRVAFLLIFLLIALGTTGFMVIEDWGFIDSLFMTVITLSTVGYQEVHPLSPAGTIFTIALIVLSVGTVAYAFSVVAAGVVEGQISQARGIIRMEKQINQLKEHTIICGFGRLGSIACRELIAANKRVIVIDSDPQVAELIGQVGAPYIIGSAYEDDVLKRARIDTAKTIVTLLPEDADNVYAVLCARDLNPSINIIARSDDERGETKLLRAGANRIISPYRVAGVGLVQRLTRPNVSEFLEIASTKKGENLALEELVVPTNSHLSGKSLEQCEIRAKTGAIVAAVIERDGNMTLSPDSSTTLSGGATLIVLGKPGSLDKLSEMLYGHAR